MFHYQGICRWCLSTKYERIRNKSRIIILVITSFWCCHRVFLKWMSQESTCTCTMDTCRLHLHISHTPNFYYNKWFSWKKIMRLRNWMNQSKVLNQQQLMCFKPGIFLTNDIQTWKCSNNKPKIFFDMLYTSSKSKASLWALRTNMSAMKRTTTVYQN